MLRAVRWACQLCSLAERAAVDATGSVEGCAPFVVLFFVGRCAAGFFHSLRMTWLEMLSDKDGHPECGNTPNQPLAEGKIIARAKVHPEKYFLVSSQIRVPDRA